MTLGSRVSAVLKKCTRKPPDAAEIVRSSKAGSKKSGAMERCLTTLDLISMGVGSITGANLYIIPNQIASLAGGAGVISLALTTLVSLTTGLHYAELATILPNTAGSIYMYVYFTLGEVPAVIAGWSLLAEYLVGGCFALIGFSSVVDSMSGGYISEYGKEATDSLGLPHIDFVAALVCILLTWIIASGVEMSVGFVKVMNVITVVVLVFFFTVALWVGTEDNWEDKGFVPFGMDGIVATIPMSYYAIVGFDSLATAGDECKTPNKSIPIALFATVIIGGFLLTALPVFFITYVLPMDKIPEANGILEVFGPVGYHYGKYIMGVGAITSLLTTIFGGLFPTTRVAYAISKERFIFKYFDRICPKRHTPFRATIVCGTIATLMAAFLDLHLLLGFGVLAALLCYVFVVAAALVCRYQTSGQYKTPETNPSAPNVKTALTRKSSTFRMTYATFSPVLDDGAGSKSKFNQLRYLAFSYFKIFLLIIHLLIILCCVLVAIWHKSIADTPYVVMVIFAIAVVLIVFLFIIMLTFPQIPKLEHSFRTRMIPYISLITTTINIYFMTLFDTTAWAFYCGWLGLGLLIYLLYGLYVNHHHETFEKATSPQSDTAPILEDDVLEKESSLSMSNRYDVDVEGSKDIAPILEDDALEKETSLSLSNRDDVDVEGSKEEQEDDAPAADPVVAATPSDQHVEDETSFQAN